MCTITTAWLHRVTYFILFLFFQNGLPVLAAVFSEIETDLLAIETALPEIKTALLSQ